MKKTIKKAEEHLQVLCQHLDGSITKDHGIFTMEIGKNMGTGQIKCLCFNRFMTALEFDVSLFQDMEIPLHIPGTEFLYFGYVLEGEATLKLQGPKTKLFLEPFRTSVICSTQENKGSLFLKKDTRLVFNLIGIDKIRYQNENKAYFEGLHGKLKLLLSEFGHENKLIHKGRYNLKIGEQVKLLNQTNWNNDISSHLNFGGLCNLILANQIEQYYIDVVDSEENLQLTKTEVQRVAEVSDFIRNYPEVQHSVKSLCINSGLSPSKLQEGFKFMHNRTASDFIRNVRIEKSEHLIKTTDLNISEVVYSIGLTSRSYFCKIFKLKYGCSPKQYKNMANKHVLV